MAQKRMLDKKISISEQVSSLPLEAQIIFTWSIPHADDLGLLPSSLKTLKAMIVPMMNISQETFDFQINKLVEAGLYEIFEDTDENKLIPDKYYKISKFKEHQTLKKDRKPVTYLKKIENWEQVEALGFQLETIGNPSEVKRREDKLSKEKRREELGLTCKKDYSEFKNVKLEDEEYQKLIEKIGEKNTKLLIEELGGYLASTNKKYSSHYATLLNWARRKALDYQKGIKKRTIA